MSANRKWQDRAWRRYYLPVPKKRQTRTPPTRHVPKRRLRKAAPVVAIVNTNDDLVLALRSRLIEEGYEIALTHADDFEPLVEAVTKVVRPPGR